MGTELVTAWAHCAEHQSLKGPPGDPPNKHSLYYFMCEKGPHGPQFQPCMWGGISFLKDLTSCKSCGKPSIFFLTLDPRQN